MNGRPFESQLGRPLLQVGFTLVELMVAMVVGLIVMAGIGQIFIHSKRSAALQDELSMLQENGRYAMQLLRNDILDAGYLGCGHVASLADSIRSTGSYADNFTVGVNGYEASSSGWIPPLPPELDDPAIGSDDVLPGTDVITVRYAEGDGLRMTQPKDSYLFRVTNLSTEAGACAGGTDSYSGLCAGDLMIVSDCTKARTFVIQGLHVGGGSLAIYHDNPAWGDASDLEPANHFNPAYSYLFKATTVSYFIHMRDPASGVPSLYRKVGNGAPEELVEGVENMQILYGVDSDGDNIPNQFLHADSVGNFQRVVSVRVALLLRTITEKANRPASAKNIKLLDTELTTPADRHVRRVFGFTVRIRNQ